MGFCFFDMISLFPTMGPQDSSIKMGFVLSYVFCWFVFCHEMKIRLKTIFGNDLEYIISKYSLDLSSTMDAIRPVYIWRFSLEIPRDLEMKNHPGDPLTCDEYRFFVKYPLRGMQVCPKSTQVTGSVSKIFVLPSRLSQFRKSMTIKIGFLKFPDHHYTPKN